MQSYLQVRTDAGQKGHYGAVVDCFLILIPSYTFGAQTREALGSTVVTSQGHFPFSGTARSVSLA